MATLIVGGQHITIPSDQVEEMKRKLMGIEPGGFMTQAGLDSDGDEIWAMIPHGTPVVILGWDTPASV